MTHLGELVKNELEKRDCGYGYNPQTETYIPWYRVIKFNVEYKRYLDEKDDLGSISLKNRLIEIKKRRVEGMAEALYHEIQHADIYPLDIAIKIMGGIGGFWLAYYNSQGSFRLTIASLAGIGATLVVDSMFQRIENWYIEHKENKKFGS